MKELIKRLRSPRPGSDILSMNSHYMSKAAVALESYQWKPMESAPKDGTDIMVYFELPDLSKDWMRTVFVYWSKREERWNYSGRAASGYSKCYEPTHWKPLPPAPEGV